MHGTLIDFLGHKIPNAPVSIGETTVLTDAQGRFSIADVPATYDLFAVVNPAIGGGSGFYGWVYQGLTRRDPTIQVYRGVADRSANAHVTVTNGVFSDTSETRVAFGSPDGSSSMAPNSAEVTILSGLSWYGPTTATGRAHALRWTVDDNGIPTAYDAYVDQIAAGTNDETIELPITFPNTAVTSAIISGTVTAATAAQRRNFVFARFTTNATMSLIGDWDATDTFSYLVPSLANSVITVAAAAGFTGEGYSVVHKDVSPGTTGIALSIPAPPVATAPAPGTAVGPSSMFQWASDSKVFVFHAEDRELYRGLFVVTAQKQLKLPVFPAASFELRSGADHYWDVEVHRSWQTVDQAAGSNGFQDAFATREESPVGSLRGDGNYSVSARRGFTMQ